MKKRTFGRFTAVGIAALTAVPAFIIPASAAAFTKTSTSSGTTTTKNVSGTVYYVEGGAANTYYSTPAAAVSAGGSGTAKSIDLNSINPNPVYVKVTSVAYGEKIEFSSLSDYGNDANVYKIVSSGSSSGSSSTTDSFYVPSTANKFAENNGLVYKAGTGYFPSLAAAKAAGYDISLITTKTPEQGYSSTYCYFSYIDGKYYSSEADVKAVHGINASYYVPGKGSSTSTAGTTTVYKSSATGLYYLTSSEAAAAGGTVTSYSSIVDGVWFNKRTGYFYATEALAKSDTNNPSADVQYAPYYGYNDPYYLYNSGYNPYYYYYNDPIAQYYYNLANKTTTTTTTTTASSTEPVITGTRVVGWTAIANKMSTYKNKTLAIKLNEATQITKSVLTAAAKNNTTLKLTMSNGAVWTIKGSDIKTAKTIDLETIYNTSNIPTTLTKKAKKGAVSSSQFTIGKNVALGCEADLTVNFAKSRAGKTVKLYRYNSSKNTLSLIDTAKITSTGAATFTVTAGGDYIAVIG